VGSLGFPDIKHAADILVPDFPGQLELVRKALDRLSVRSDFGLDELEGDFFFDLGIEDLINLSHSTFAEFFDNLIPAGKGAARG
jgi:hypothetical protein